MMNTAMPSSTAKHLYHGCTCRLSVLPQLRFACQFFVVIRAIIDCYDQHKLVISLDATANFPPRHMVQLRQSSSAGADFGSIPGAQGALVPSLGDPKPPESC